MFPLPFLLPRGFCVAFLLVGLATLHARAVEPRVGTDAVAEDVAAEPSQAGDCRTAHVAGELDVWVASTRRLPAICRTPEHARLSIEQLIDDGDCRRWERADLAGLLAEPARPLVVFVHGNRYEPADAKTEGISLAQRMATARGGLPPRVMVLSWPSQKQGVLLRDGRRKYDRAYADGQYLAWLLAQVEPRQPVAIIGHSFGALVAAEALDEIARRDEVLTTGIRWVDRPGRTHLVFVAPALRADALAPRGPFGRSIAGIDRFTLLINSRDVALRFFPLLEPDVRAPALGYVGMPRRWLPAEVEYHVLDAAAIVGTLHTMRRYLDSRPLAERIAGGTLDGLSGE